MSGPTRRPSALNKFRGCRWRCSAQRRCFSAFSPHQSGDGARVAGDKKTPKPDRTAHEHERYFRLRSATLGKATGGDLAWCYPRFDAGKSASTPHDLKTVDLSEFREVYDRSLHEDQTLTHVRARVLGQMRRSQSLGKYLHFIVLQQRGKIESSTLQIVFKSAKPEDAASESRYCQLNDLLKALRPGDYISVIGHPHRTETGELSLLATEPPVLLAPALHELPRKTMDRETLSRRPHVDMMIDRRKLDILRLRSRIEGSIERFLDSNGMDRVRTPILAGSAGGATARPFETLATELPSDRLALRIAPELYLKRLIVGGCHGVYEMGPAFRNEGIDNTHNPEFTICEFYRQYTNLDDLMALTEELFRCLADKFDQLRQEAETAFVPLEIDLGEPFAVVDFIPVLEESISRALCGSEAYRLPSLEHDDAMTELQSLYAKLNRPLPSNPIVPRLLDDLCSHYIESRCIAPTWVKGHPASMSPLAKSYTDENGQLIAARAELFIGGQEYVNCYEEENNPLEQRRKFLQQKLFKQQLVAAGSGDESDTTMETAVGESMGFKSGIDESYIEALEWGMPPTGGWGCGVDRIVMLFAGAKRIADVLPFGTLQNVVAMGKPWRT